MRSFWFLDVTAPISIGFSVFSTFDFCLLKTPVILFHEIDDFIDVIVVSLKCDKISKQITTGCLFQSVLFQQHANFHNFCPNSTKLGSFESWIMEILLLVYKFSEYCHILPTSLSLKILDFSPELKKLEMLDFEKWKKSFSQKIFVHNHAKLVRNCKIKRNFENFNYTLKEKYIFIFLT